MRAKCLIVIVLIIMAVGQPGQLSAATGLGIIIGEPTGLSIKINNFPVMGIGWSWNDYFHFHIDYWVKNSRLEPSLYWFFGVGAKITTGQKDGGDNGDIGLGIRFPLGLRYFFSRNFELFGELAPGMKLLPGTDFEINGGIGVRFYF